MNLNTDNELLPKFWYEANACLGYVESFKDLSKMLTLQLEESNGINNIDDFLDRSMKTKGEELNFGKYSEHCSDYSLRQYLTSIDMLDKFVNYFNNSK